MKECYQCHKTKPLKDFYKHSHTSDGHRGYCKDCASKNSAERYRKRFVEIAIYQRKLAKTQARKKKYVEYRRENRLKNPDKYYARSIVTNALQSGKLKKEPCNICGTIEKVEAHHNDYSKPLEVIWLCFPHHLAVHGKNVVMIRSDNY
jgi:hypothetical protein